MGVLTASRAAMRAENAEKVADQSRGNALTQITTYIPSDILVLYGAALTAAAPAATNATASERTRWLIFALGATLCVVLPFLNQWAAMRSTTGSAQRPRWRKQAAVAGLALIAFTTYAMALPGSAFSNLFGNNTGHIAAIGALVLSLVLPQLAAGLRINPSSS